MNSLSLVGDILDIDELRSEESSNVGGARGAEIHALLQERLLTWQTAEVIDRLLARDVWCAPLQDLSEVSRDPQIAHLGLIRDVPNPGGGTYQTIGPTVSFSTDEAATLAPPPGLGEHRDFILSMIGVSGEEIAELEARGAFG